MMWYAAIVRLLRRRIVLAIIFFLSLTYCLVNLLGSVSCRIRKQCKGHIFSIKFMDGFYCREDSVRMISKKLNTNETDQWCGERTMEIIRKSNGQPNAEIRYREKFYWLTMRASFVHEINCWIMDAVKWRKNLFNTVALRVAMRDVVLFMNDALAVVWIRIKWVPHFWHYTNLFTAKN